MDRRQFLIRAGAIAGQLLVPRFFDRASAFVENHDEPLLEIPRDAARHLAVSWPLICHLNLHFLVFV